MLMNVELLTKEEQITFGTAEAEMESATAHLKATVESIGREHRMMTESYMEWRSWVKVDGKYILYYRE